MSDPIHGWERLLLAVQRARQHAGASSLEYDDSDEAVSAARRLGLDGSAGRLGEGTLASLLPPALQQNSEIGDVLTAASEVETMDAPEVARILADYAYTLAQRLDPNSEGRGVLQFKTSLHTLLRARRQAQSAPPSDKVKAIRDFFTKYREHIQKLEEDSENNREALGKAWKTARVLGKVLEEISGTERVQVDRELAQDIKEAAEKTEEFKKQKYNIVPLGIEDASEPILQLREVQIALQFLSHPEGLPQHPHGGSFADILEYLQFTFGFQEDNVNNQREHLVLLMANDLTHQMLLPDTHPMPALKVAVQELYNKVLANFFRWGDFVKADRAYLRNLDSVQGQLLHVALYFLIWGEAANVRFVPECLCYIFHRMAEELCELAKKPVAGKSAAISLPVGSAEEAGPYAFLDNVISPIYAVISKEAEYAGHGTTAKGHQKWRNYDDLNEFFWSERCLKLGWPLDLDHGFFTFPPQEAKEMLSEEDPLLTAPTAVPMAGRQQPKRRARRLSKTLFVEWRTFWHIFHSFDRLWIFLIIMLQGLIIIAFSGPSKRVTLEKVLTIFPTLAILQSLEASTDVMMAFGAYRSMHPTIVWRKVLRLLMAATWAGSLTFFCIKMLQEGSSSSSRPYLGLYAVLLLAYVAPRVVINFVLRFAALRKQTDKIDHWTAVRTIKWLYQEEFYVGRSMYESTASFTLYSMFWGVLLISKFLFSYYFQIQPLVGPTSYIVDFASLKYRWHDVVSGENWNILTVASLWLPVGTIYMLDIQIWYTVLSALLGGVIGAWWHLGEIRSLSMLRARFRSFPEFFTTALLPQASFAKARTLGSTGRSVAAAVNEVSGRRNARRFALAWNEIIRTMREEDYLSHKEVDLLLLPANPGNSALVHWPLFLLANQIYLAMGHVKGHESGDGDLWRKICEDEYMRCAVAEVYETLGPFLLDITAGRRGPTNEQRIVNFIFDDIATSIRESCFVTSFRLEKVEAVHSKLAALTGLLVQAQDDAKTAKAVKLLQDLWEVVRRDFLSRELQQQLEQSMVLQDERTRANLFAHIRWPSDPGRAKRLHLLLTMKESAQEVPRNLEARRRLEFFTNSLFMAMPEAPPVKKMLSFCVMTPYFSEIVAYSLKELTEENEDGISTLFYLQKIFPDEWANFLERIGSKPSDLEAKVRTGEDLTDLRMWASFRGQTLARTVRGMMYYRRALQLLAFLEAASDSGVPDVELGQFGHYPEEERSGYLRDSTRALADLKFTYVVTCQIYGVQKQYKDPRYHEIFALMKGHPGLRIAYIDEKEITAGEGRVRKEHYSCLLRVDAFGQEQEIYRVKLPGPAKLGEGKPENQNHAIIFTRGHAIQTIDMNQDNYLEEALKMRNLLEEFRGKSQFRSPTILGVREHVFTGSVSSLASFMSNQETSFVTLGQRVLAYPLKVRMHYGHPDVFDRLFHITRGGISKSSKLIHISEDIFAGFNTTLRQGNVTHHEYIQVGKGRDVGLNQIALFEGKVSSGNGEQMLSRDVYRLGQQFDFYRMLSFYFTSVGFYVSTLLTVWCIYFFLYGKVYLALSGVEETLTTRADILGNSALQAALSSQFLLQIGVFTAIPMIVVFVIEKGFAQAVLSFITMQLQLASVFFTFSLGTRAHYFGRTLLHGGAKYRSTGRGFVVRHEKFAELYRIFSRTHFVKGLEVAMLLIVYLVYGSSASTTAYVLLTISSWFLVISWCFGPFIFNPSGFEWQKVVEDFDDWTAWLLYRGGVGVKSNLSWEAWWEEEIGHVRSIRSRFWEVLLSLRFFVFQYGIVYSLNVAGGSTSIWVYIWSWVVAGAIVILFWVSNLGRTWDTQLQVRVLQSGLLCGSVVAVVVLIILTPLTVADVLASTLVFIPTGYGLLQILIALRPAMEFLRLWKQVQAFARLYDALMGGIIFLPVAVLSWFPFISTFQSRLMFNQAFSRGLEISLILAGKQQQDGK